MGLRLLNSGSSSSIGPASVSGGNHANAYGLRITTAVPNLLFRECTVRGSAGTYNVGLYSVSGSTLTLVDSGSFVLNSSGVDTVVSLNLRAGAAGDYWLGFSDYHGSLYRWSTADSGQFPFTASGLASILYGSSYSTPGTAVYQYYYFFNLQIEYGEFADTGTAIYGPYSLPAVTGFQASGISWAETVPEDTTLTVYTGLADPGETPSTWDACTNGSALPTVTPGKDLYIKVIMSTTDDMITPELSNLSFMYEGSEDHSVVRIKLTETGRLKHPQGNVTVGYTAALGNLKNAAGTLSISSFEQAFDPDEEDLTLFFNPHDAENVEVAIDLSVAVNKVTYEERKSGDESIEIAGMDLSVAVYDTSENPV